MNWKYFVRSIQERGVVFVQPGQLFLVDLHRLKQAGITAGGRPHPVGEGTQLNRRGFQIVHILDFPAGDKFPL